MTKALTARLHDDQHKITFIENIVLKKGQKNLSLKVTLAVEFTMSLVGVMTFFSLATMVLIQNFTTMIDKIKSVVVGVALAGRMATKLQTIRHWNRQLTNLNLGLRAGVRVPHSPLFKRIKTT